MKKPKNIAKIISGIVFIALAIFITVKPEIVKESAINGILLCGRVIIPSLFAFTVCVLFIMKSGITDYLNRFSFLTERLFGLSAELFCIVLLSFIGGYPIGARLLNEATENGRVSKEQAERMLYYCVNAGPGFIVAAVGSSLLGSKEIGYILLAAHLLASFSIMLALREKSEFKPARLQNQSFSFSDCFVSAVSDASSATMSICGYVILFSVITAYAEHFTKNIESLKFLTLSLEVTTAIGKTNNIFLISFLLGFAGISVWCQILSSAKALKINLAKFAAARITHGMLSSIFTFVLLKIFPVSLACISNGADFSQKLFYATPALSVSLIIMGVFFIISVFGKKHTGKLLNDVV